MSLIRRKCDDERGSIKNTEGLDFMSHQAAHLMCAFYARRNILYILQNVSSYGGGKFGTKGTFDKSPFTWGREPSVVR